MKIDEKFSYKSKYNTYSNCNFVCNRYADNGNLYLGIESEEEGPIANCSVNTDAKLDDDSIGIKDYSENDGMAGFLVGLGIIEQNPFKSIQSGWVTIPFYKLTESGKELFETVRNPPF